MDSTTVFGRPHPLDLPHGLGYLWERLEIPWLTPVIILNRSPCNWKINLPSL